MPTSAAQRSIWLAQRLAPGSPRYLVPALIELTGTLDLAALRQAMQFLVDRHEALRTGIADRDGVPVQRVYPAATAELRVVDVSDRGDPEDAARAAIDERLHEHVDLAGPSLLRTSVIRLGPTRHQLVVIAHHLVCDAWSSALLVRDLGLAYPAACAGTAPAWSTLEIQFADYAAWQRQVLTEDVAAEHLRYWRTVLTPLPEPLALPVGRARPAERGAGGVVHARLDAAEVAAIAAAARDAGTTPYTVLLTGLAVVLGRLTGQREFCLGSVLASRDEPELSDVVGCLVNTLPVRIDLSGRPGFADLLARVGERLLAAFTHRLLPFEHLVEALRVPREVGRLPLCDVLATMAPAVAPPLVLPDLTANVARLDTSTAKADLTIEASPTEDGAVDLYVEYDRTVLDPDLAQWTVAALRRVLAAGIDRPHRPVSTLEVISAAERSALLVAAAGPPVKAPAPATLWQRFAARAAQAAGATAVEAGDASLSYTQLAAAAESVAAAVVAAGVRPGERVGVCTGRTSSWVVGLIGVLRSRAAFVPLDPTMPAARLSLMLEDAAVNLVLADATGAEAITAGLAGMAVLRLDELPDAGSGVPHPPRPDDIAYVIYTSGSTGRPKGVAIQHASLVRLIDETIPMVGLGAGDRVLQVASPSFDAAVLDLGLTLVSGATLCLAPPEEMVPGPVLRDTLARRRITYALIQPSALALIPSDPPLPELRSLLSGGEAPDAALLARWAPGRSFINAYGPTEATIWATAWRYPHPPPADPRLTPPIGRPLPGVSAHVLDGELEPVPVGLPGELYLGGDNLARGYLGAPELTAAAFLPDPYGAPGARLYRTGDRVMRRGDGELVFLGRVDDQVKIRGFRVEPGEAEHALRSQPEVAAAAVVVRTRRGEAELVGYYVPRQGARPESTQLRAELARKLPAYLVPAHLVELAAMPLGPTGKLDRAALPAPAIEVSSRAPRTRLEQDVARIWQEVLDLDAVGAEDNFFDLGGHSLALARVHSRLVTLVGRDIPIVELFRHPTVATLAGHLAPPTGSSTLDAGTGVVVDAFDGRLRGQRRREALARARQAS